MGKDLLGQDYVLKQLTASLTYPESPLGKRYWRKVYQQALTLFGTTKIPINTFNKVWIVPDTAVVYQDNTRAIIGDTHLKVMLEEDYMALNKSEILNMKSNKREEASPSPTEEQINQINNFTSQITKEIILPVIEEEVNYGKNFSHLRQIYSSLILATWFKQKLKQSIISQIYVDQKKIKGVDADDPQIKEKIYNQYLEAYKKGVYNYIKSDYDPSSRKNIRRKYYSGGFTAVGFASSGIKMFPLNWMSNKILPNSTSLRVGIELSPYGKESLEKDKSAIEARKDAINLFRDRAVETTASSGIKFSWQTVAYKEMTSEEKETFIAGKIQNTSLVVGLNWKNNRVFPFKLTDASGKVKEIAIIWDFAYTDGKIKDKDVLKVLFNNPVMLEKLNNTLMECYIKAIQIYPWKNFEPGNFRIIDASNFNSAGPFMLNVGDIEVKRLLEDIERGDPVVLQSRKAHLTASFAHELGHNERDEIMGGGYPEIVSQIIQFIADPQHNEIFNKGVNRLLDRVNKQGNLDGLDGYDKNFIIGATILIHKLKDNFPEVKRWIVLDSGKYKITALRKLKNFLSSLNPEELNSLRKDLLDELLYLGNTQLENMFSEIIEKDNQAGSSAMRLVDMEDVAKTMAITIVRKSKIRDIVEKPLIKACEILYDKNIRTFSTSANKKDLNFSLLNDGKTYAYIMIDYKWLSDENKKTINDLLNGSDRATYKDVIIRHSIERGGESIDILIPINEESTDVEINNKAVEATDIFRKQKMTWAPVYTLDQLRKVYYFPEATVEDFKDDFYYDIDNQLFYLTKEHYGKVMDSESKVGSSALEKPGGIDLGAENLNLDVRGQSSSSSLMINNVPFNIQNFQGFTFQIIKFKRNEAIGNVLYPDQEKELSHLSYEK